MTHTCQQRLNTMTHTSALLNTTHTGQQLLDNTTHVSVSTPEQHDIHICQQWMINTQHNPHLSAATEYNTHLLVTAEQHDTPASSCWTTWHTHLPAAAEQPTAWHTHMLTTAGQHNKHTWSVEQQAADHTTHWHSEYPWEWSADTNHNDNADITIIIDFLRGSTVTVTPCWPRRVNENVLNASTSHHQSS